MPAYEVGQKVRYKAIGGRLPHALLRYSRVVTVSLTYPLAGPESNTPTSVGTIMSVATEPRRISGHNVQASEEDPRYEVRITLLPFVRCNT